MNKYITLLLSFLEMLVGTALTAAPFGMIILPLGYVAAGATGLAKVLSWLLPVPLSLIVLILNIGLLLLGLIFIGKKFVAKTIAVGLIFPAMLEIFSRYPLTSLEGDPILATIVAGVMLGVGAGLILRSGASAGGFDVLGIILNKKFKLPITLVMNMFDLVVIVAQAVEQTLPQTIYGLLIITIYARVAGHVVNWGTGESRIMIFSNRNEEIRQVLLHQLVVGLTCLKAEGGYDSNSMDVLVSVVPYNRVAEVKKAVTAIDPTAFVVIDEIQSVLGRGWTLDRYFERQITDH